jgi:ABC-type bacteriocin/lantibiotic exporter with double-glycine peptidase domain
MVLAGRGTMISEAMIAQMCDCTILGTNAFQAVQVLRQLGFEQAGKYNLTMADLTKVLDEGEYPIVYVDLQPIEQSRDIHAMIVVTAIDEQSIQVLDPLKGERVIDRRTFESAWLLMNGLTILVGNDP